MHNVCRQALDRQTITAARDSEGAAEPSAAGVKKPLDSWTPCTKWQAKI